MATSRLQFSCNRTIRRAMRRLVSLPPWRCCFVIYPKFPAVSSTFAWLFTRLPDKLHLVMAAICLQISCKWTKRRATWSIVAIPPGRCCLPALSASLQLPPSHWPSLPYDDFVSSGLRALYRSPLRGLPISPARRAKGSCKCVRSWDCWSIAESRP